MNIVQHREIGLILTKVRTENVVCRKTPQQTINFQNGLINQKC